MTRRAGRRRPALCGVPLAGRLEKLRMKIELTSWCDEGRCFVCDNEHATPAAKIIIDGKSRGWICKSCSAENSERLRQRLNARADYLRAMAERARSDAELDVAQAQVGIEYAVFLAEVAKFPEKLRFPKNPDPLDFF